MNSLNIDQTIEYVKNLVDNIQCAICDKTDGQRMRYSCGHAACYDCVIDAELCQICLTPPQTSSAQPKLDDALTQRVKHASVLLKTCQDLFNTDVLKRKRLSEQLRIEKELFPKCIQAPVKYENKRKSTIYCIKTKDNNRRKSKLYPGEETSTSFKENITMENSYVQQWLNKNDKDFTRKPLRNLNVNTQFDNNSIFQIKNNLQSKLEENVPILKTNRKRSHFKTTTKKKSPSANRKSNVVTYNSNSKKVKKELHQSFRDDGWNETWKKCANDESGIFLDNDLILINDSQETINDKDKNAWLAVLEANKNEEIESTSEDILDNSDIKKNSFTNNQTSTKSDGLPKVNQNTKVPFYKKGYITETCTYCSNEANKAAGQSKEVKVTIDNDNFTTTIMIINNVKDNSKFNTTNSVSAQTDIIETIPMDIGFDVKNNDEIVFTNLYEKDCREDVTSHKLETQSVDLFADEGKHIANECEKKYIPVPITCLVIEESDSDSDMNESGPLPVKVDVHRSCDESEYGVLGEIVNIQEYDTRLRRGPRGLTPTSTDSSEKENFNPNRIKKKVPKKKKSLKK